ncbi:hypothetical protein SDC9_202234 [bioreactor metagenome]|uniref:Uncharacterized protein n=1 Tax=bioreactor metagenome TaxID=1076179 RepID=A0A645J516_9ZZZZ
MDEIDLLHRDAALHKLCFEVVVHIKASIVMRRGKIAEYKLRQPLLPVLLPYPINLIHADVDLAFLAVRQHGVDEPLVERKLSSIVGNL